MTAGRIKGMDLSTLLEVEERGGRFSDGGTYSGAMEILAGYGMNLVRLRLWNDPYSPEGEPYGAGTNDLARTMCLARRAKDIGAKWMLDLHYSDFWADPGKQTMPKAWRGLDTTGLERAVGEYTRSVLETLRDAGLAPDMVSVGNEITNGLLWPLGRYPDMENIVRFVNAGLRAVRKVCPEAETVIHLDNGANERLFRAWFDAYFATGGMDFDVIGMSYYPFWHGKMSALRDNMNAVAQRYRKDVLVAETSMGFTLKDYGQYERLAPDERKGMAATAALARNIEYPMTCQGQSRFIEDLWAVIRQVPENRGRGFIWWEPAWLPVPGSGWATEAALAYTGEKGPGGNEWANQALFDYDGRALPALAAIKALEVT